MIIPWQIKAIAAASIAIVILSLAFALQGARGTVAKQATRIEAQDQRISTLAVEVTAANQATDACVSINTENAAAFKSQQADIRAANEQVAAADRRAKEALTKASAATASLRVADVARRALADKPPPAEYTKVLGDAIDAIGGVQ